MSTKKLPGQFNNYDPEKIGKGIAGIAKEIVEKDEKRKTGVKHTLNVGQTKVKRNFSKYKDTEMETYGFRIYPKDKRRFEEYFKKRGMTFSQGVRMVMKDFMERQGLH